MRWLFILFGLAPAFSNANEEDIPDRALRAPYFPNLSVSYALTDNERSVIMFGISWEFDGISYGERIGAAIEIARLRREQERIRQQVPFLDTDFLPTDD